VACPGSSPSTVSGRSPLSLPASGAGCSVTISGPSDVVQTSYQLDLGPQ
jgi:hypothetical protein